MPHANGQRTWTLLLGSYMSLWLIPHWWPALKGSPWVAAYAITLPPVLMALGVITLWGGIGIALSSLRGKAPGARHRGLLTVGALGTLWAVAILLVSKLYTPLPTGSGQLEFDAQRWRTVARTADIAVPSLRQQMLEHTLTQVLPGSDETKILALLGPGEPDPRLAGKPGDRLYYLGRQRDTPVPLDHEWLLLHFDEQGRFQYYRLLHD